MKLGFHQTLIEAFARSHHDPVLAKSDGLPIGIFGGMSDR